MDRTYSSSVRDNEDAGVTRRPWQFAYREALSPYVFTWLLIIIGLYMGAYTAICPLGAGDLPWTHRLAYIAVCSALVAPPCHAGYVVTLYLVRFWTSCSVAAAVAAHAFVAAWASTAMAYGIDSLFRSELSAHGFATVYLFMGLSVALCSAVVHYLVSQRVRNEPADSAPTDPEQEPPRPPDRGLTASVAVRAAAARPSSKFLHRLPRDVGQDIVCLKMNDHYVHVITTSGQCAILMRFTDAMAELGGIGGRVHRSYWVAWSHVEGWEKRNQRPLLRLTGGQRVPVSRTYLADVRAALKRHRTGADPTPRTPPGHT